MYEETDRGDVVISFGDQLFLFVVDEIDVAAGPRLLALVRAALGSGASAVVLDLSAVEFIDCAGLRALMGAEDRLLAAGRSVTVPAPSPVVVRLLELVAVTDFATAPAAVAPAAPGHASPLGAGRA